MVRIISAELKVNEAYLGLKKVSILPAWYCQGSAWLTNKTEVYKRTQNSISKHFPSQMKTGNVVELAEVEQEDEGEGENQFNEMARHGKELLLKMLDSQ